MSETPLNRDESEGAEQPQTAMLLADHEWFMLAQVCHFWLYEHNHPVEGEIADLCRRIKAAAE